jgi:regulator of RNase E activity RraA
MLFTASACSAATKSYHSITIRRNMMINSSASIQYLLQDLRTVDTSSLCDADKTISGGRGDHLIRVMDSQTIRPMNHVSSSVTSNPKIVMAGIARTVQFTEPNDFLPVLRGLQEAQKDEVLVVNTLASTKAVAGEIFCAEASRKQLSGIIIEGPIRDTRYLSNYPPVRFYASSSTPYSGAIQSVGTMQCPVTCGGITVRPGDIIVGDEDGVLVGSAIFFQTILPIAKQIQNVERKLLLGITSQIKKSLVSMTNYDDHLAKRMQGFESKLEFRV